MKGLVYALFALLLAAPAEAQLARMVRDINTKPSNAGSLPGNLITLNGIAYFSAYDGANGSELWRSDGTGAGTWLVKDIRPGSTASNPGPFAIAGGVIVFPATDYRGRNIWRSDGTAA